VGRLVAPIARPGPRVPNGNRLKEPGRGSDRRYRRGL